MTKRCRERASWLVLLALMVGCADESADPGQSSGVAATSSSDGVGGNDGPANASAAPATGTGPATSGSPTMGAGEPAPVPAGPTTAPPGAGTSTAMPPIGDASGGAGGASEGMGTVAAGGSMSPDTGSGGTGGIATSGAGGVEAGTGAAGGIATGGVGGAAGGAGGLLGSGGMGGAATGGAGGQAVVVVHPDDAVEFEGHWYRLTVAETGGAEAQAICEEDGGYLACVESEAEDAFVFTLAGTTRPWIGLNNEADVNTWVWVNGSPVTFTHWQPGQPDAPSTERWVKVAEDGTWDDGNIPSSFICEWEG